MPDIRTALPALLLLCACTAPRLTVTEVGDPFATASAAPRWASRTRAPP